MLVTLVHQPYMMRIAQLPPGRPREGAAEKDPVCKRRIRRRTVVGHHNELSRETVFQLMQQGWSKRTGRYFFVRFYANALIKRICRKNLIIPEVLVWLEFTKWVDGKAQMSSEIPKSITIITVIINNNINNNNKIKLIMINCPLSQCTWGLQILLSLKADSLVVVL